MNYMLILVGIIQILPYSIDIYIGFSSIIDMDELLV